MVTDVATLLSMSQSQLDELFRSSQSGPIPDGPAKGTAIISPGTVFTPELAEVVTLLKTQRDGPRSSWVRKRGHGRERWSCCGFVFVDEAAQ